MVRAYVEFGGEFFVVDLSLCENAACLLVHKARAISFKRRQFGVLVQLRQPSFARHLQRAETTQTDTRRSKHYPDPSNAISFASWFSYDSRYNSGLLGQKPEVVTVSQRHRIFN